MLLLEPVNIDEWSKIHAASFVPPICNKLMHKKQLSIMFVGGPNTRTDFHIEGGSELFLMLRGNMKLPIVEKGNRRLVEIKEGCMFVLPPRIPHSPQRPESGSLGLVIERERVEGEMDCLRWYRDFEICGETLFERYFRCNDLGRDLVPITVEYKNSQECITGVPTETSVVEPAPLQQDLETNIVEPIHLMDWVRSQQDILSQGKEIDVMAWLKHPDPEFYVRIAGGGGEPQQLPSTKYETFLYQLVGNATIVSGESEVLLPEGFCCVLDSRVAAHVVRPEGSVGMVVRQIPVGKGDE